VERGLGRGVGEAPATVADGTGRVGGGGVRAHVDDDAAAWASIGGSTSLTSTNCAATLASSLDSNCATVISRIGTILRAGVDGVVDQEVDAPRRRGPRSPPAQGGVSWRSAATSTARTRRRGRTRRLLEAARQGAAPAGVRVVTSLAGPPGACSDRDVPTRPGQARAVALPIPGGAGDQGRRPARFDVMVRVSSTWAVGRGWACGPGCGRPVVRRRSVVLGDAEVEDAAVTGHEPVAEAVRRVGHPTMGWLSLVAPVEP